jgi:sialidase-1
MRMRPLLKSAAVFALMCQTVALAASDVERNAISQALQPEFYDVFKAGEGGFKSIRIPSLVVSQAGTVLALVEGRHAQADQANNKLVLKRSSDGGRTWGMLQLVAEDGANCLNNPCTVVDRSTGRIIVMCQSYPMRFNERDVRIQPGFDGPAVVRNYLICSDDDGQTWSRPEDVTRTTKHGPPVTIVASGPGIGIQLRRGPHAGRLLVPFNEGPFGQWNVLSVFSDDHARTLKLGEAAPGCRVANPKGGEISLVNEVQMVELADGSVLLNGRKWGGRPVRKTALSRDGGVTWTKIEEATDLRDPGCMASIFRYTFADEGGRSRILYSGPDSDGRDHGTVHLSYDEGKSWPVKRVLFAGSFAYSVLTALPGGDIGCLFETDDTGRMVFARFPLAWLTEGKDTGPSDFQHPSPGSEPPRR